ncbi:MAG: glycosyltransferase [Planctomycetota bacterium]
MDLSYVIVSHNRRDTLLGTLARLPGVTPLPTDRYEIHVVDNGSTDGTAAAVAASFPEVRLHRRTENEGVWARSLAFAHCRGRHVILLDDDSYPADADTVARSIAHLDATPAVAAVGGRCLLPDGRGEACALPGVMLSGAVCLRRAALDRVGGFRREFFRKAGEYDLSFRLWRAGWRVERYDDLTYRHDKHAGGRDAGLAFRMDLRNNLILVERFFPPAVRRAYRKDFLHRYAAFARRGGHGDSMSQAIAEARAWARRERESGRQTLGPDVLETVLQWGAQKRAVAEWAQRHGVRRVVLADLGKNLYATWRAARRAGLRVTAIAENHPALAGGTYRGVAVRRDAEALGGADGVVLANVNPAQAGPRLEQLRRRWAGPVLSFWEPKRLGDVSPRAVSTYRSPASGGRVEAA